MESYARTRGAVALRGALVALTTALGVAGSLTAGIGGRAVQSQATLRFAGIVRQQDDHTCGYAAAATVLQSMGLAADERSLLAHLDSRGAGRGATLGGIGRVTAHWGVESFAVRSTWEHLVAYFVRYDEPVLGLVNPDRPHFTVILYADAWGVYLADPSLGYLVLDPGRFAERWTGVLLFLRPPDGFGLQSRQIALALERMHSRHHALLRTQAGLHLMTRARGARW